MRPMPLEENSYGENQMIAANAELVSLYKNKLFKGYGLAVNGSLVSPQVSTQLITSVGEHPTMVVTFNLTEDMTKHIESVDLDQVLPASKESFQPEAARLANEIDNHPLLNQIFHYRERLIRDEAPDWLRCWVDYRLDACLFHLSKLRDGLVNYPPQQLSNRIRDGLKEIMDVYRAYERHTSAFTYSSSSLMAYLTFRSRGESLPYQVVPEK
ncbi:hypothetical protein ABU549_004413 [Yersinia enterocolitica]|uniref:hypothetical protein n=1 Tax=Yersinia enterocolitica TaxID=630 RepID=UPI00313D3F69|nr:hypothetical protein [Yersinia phage vB_YenS-P840]